LGASDFADARPSEVFTRHHGFSFPYRYKNRYGGTGQIELGKRPWRGEIALPQRALFESIAVFYIGAAASEVDWFIGGRRAW